MMPGMPVDEQTQAILAALDANPGTPVLERTPEEGRLGYKVLEALATKDEVASVEDRTIPGPGGDLPVRIYRPDVDGAAAALVYFHGGGWTIGDLDTHDGVTRALCRRSGAVVVAVDYRLAPEHRFPAAVDDAEAAFDWVVSNATDLGIDPERVAVGGDSAGGNLAAVVAQQRKGRVAFQLLIYPTVDNRPVDEASADYPSLIENADGYVLTADHMRWFSGHYFGEHDDARLDPRASPLYGDVDGVAPALVMVLEFDPLRDEGLAYGKRLADAGVPVEVKYYEGQVHTFIQMNGAIQAGDAALDDAAAALRSGVA